MNRRRVFFETITNAHRPLVAWYLARGYRVYVFDFTYRLKFMTWLRRLVHEGRVERIYFHPSSSAEGLAIDATEWFYPKAAGHPLVKHLAEWVGKEEVDLVFKYALVQSLSRYFYTRLFLEQTVKSADSRQEVTLIPESFCYWDRLLHDWCKNRLNPLNGIRIPRWPHLWSWAGCQWIKLIRHVPLYCGSGMYLLWGWFLRAFIAHRGKRESLKYRVVYAINSKFQTKFTGGRRFDFLLDHQRLTKENSAFLVGEAGEGPWVEQAHEVGYQVIRRSDYSSLRGFFKHPPMSTPVGLGIRTAWEGIRQFRAPEWLHQAAATGLWLITKETNLLEHVRFSHYVYMGQYGLIPRWRNILIRKTGAKSWWFAYSNGGGFLFHNPDEEPFASGRDFGGRMRFWAYENPDYFVSPCPQLIDYHRRHNQRIRWYHDVGNIWSEQILHLQQTRDLTEVRSEWFPHQRPDQKMIAWFDTSFVEAPNSLSTFTEAIQWYEDILRLAKEIPELLMVIKPSKDAGYYVDPGPDQQWAEPRVGRWLMQVWEKLKAHPRIRFFDHCIDPTLVVAASDLTITFCFSSVSAEALGARKRGIWYEPGERWRDTLYGKDPLLAAHGYDELRALVRKLLFEMTEEQYTDYLNQTVRGVVEEFLDGKGLTRFRALLVGNDAPELSGTAGGPETVCAPVTSDHR